MRPLSIFAIVLIVGGIVGLIVENVTWTEKEQVVDLGPVEIQSEEKKSIPIPTIAGVIAIIVGVGLLVVDRRSA
jgi:hypothetical protein